MAEAQLKAINKKEELKVRRGQIYYVDLGTGIGSEAKKVRPCVIVQNNVGNRFSPTTIVVPITHRDKNKQQPTQVVLNKALVCGNIDGVILAEQLRIIDKKRIREFIGSLTKKGVKELNKAMQVSIGV